MVSSATLEAGGYVHGILPQALVQRASEKTSTPGEVVSQEGVGKDLIDGDFDGRMTGEITFGMHEVSSQITLGIVSWEGGKG